MLKNISVASGLAVSLAPLKKCYRSYCKGKKVLYTTNDHYGFKNFSTNSFVVVLKALSSFSICCSVQGPSAVEINEISYKSAKSEVL